MLLGLHSPGLRSNGYTLAREILVPRRRPHWPRPAYAGAARTLGEELLLPSVIYAPFVVALREQFGAGVHAAAHITGGGIVGNVARLLSADLDAQIDMATFATPEIFFEIQRRGPVSADEMVRVFNCGLGMVVAIDPSVADACASLWRERIAVSTPRSWAKCSNPVPGQGGVDVSDARGAASSSSTCPDHSVQVAATSRASSPGDAQRGSLTPSGPSARAK